MRSYDIENSVHVMKGLDEDNEEEDEEICEDAPILLVDDVETDIEKDVKLLEEKLKLVQEGNERLLSEMLNEKKETNKSIALERSLRCLNTEKKRQSLLITLQSITKSVRIAQSRLRSAQTRNHGEQMIATDVVSKRKLALQRATLTIQQRIEDVRVRRESTEKMLLQSNAKISKTLKEKFDSLSTRFANRMKGTYRMKPLPQCVLARGSNLREHFDERNSNCIQQAEARLKWYGKILVRLETCKDVRSHLKLFLGSINDFPRHTKKGGNTTKKKKKSSPYLTSRANTSKIWAGSLRGL